MNPVESYQRERQSSNCSHSSVAFPTSSSALISTSGLFFPACLPRIRSSSVPWPSYPVAVHRGLLTLHCPSPSSSPSTAASLAFGCTGASACCFVSFGLRPPSLPECLTIPSALCLPSAGHFALVQARCGLRRVLHVTERLLRGLDSLQRKAGRIHVCLSAT